jgi:lipopolysaccharide/colanic/teichoic acid biosynthesis glycosyltransferase
MRGLTVRNAYYLAVDLLLIALATVLALLLRDNLEFNEPRFEDLLPYIAVTAAVAAPVLVASGINRTIWRFSAMSDYLRIIVAVVGIVLVSTLLCFLLTRMIGIARSIPVLQALVAIVLMIGARVLVRLSFTDRPRAKAFVPPASVGRENIIVVGMTTLTELYLKSIAEFARDRIRVAGIIPLSEIPSGSLVHQHPVLGTPEEMPRIFQTLEVHGIIVDRIVVTTMYESLPHRAQDALRDIHERAGVRIDFLAESVGLSPAGAAAAPFPERSSAPAQTQPMVADQAAQLAFSFGRDALAALASRPYWRMKRAFDVVVSGILLVLVAPAILVVAALAAWDVGLPTVFWQQRPGLGGRPFRLYKFRTMAAAYDTSGQRIPDTKRLSAIGLFLRRTRLDELPQLWNILCGEMSFVGPRPLLPIDQPPAFASRLLVRPGLTGWAQVMGGRDVSPADKAALDIWYVQNASLRLDIEILVRTVPVVLFGERISHEAIREAWQSLRRGGICLADGPNTGSQSAPQEAPAHVLGGPRAA